MNAVGTEWVTPGLLMNAVGTEWVTPGLLVNAVGTEWVTPGLPRMLLQLNLVKSKFSGPEFFFKLLFELKEVSRYIID